MNLTTSGRIGLGFVSQLLLIATFCLAVYDHDQQIQLMVTGAIVANSTVVMQWFFGSSSGSEKKDEVIANAIPSPAPNGGPSQARATVDVARTSS